MKRRTLLAGLVAAPSAFAGAIGSGKWIAGGTGGITRSRVGIIGTQMQNKIPSLMLPRDHTLYVVPMDAASLAAGSFFNEGTDLEVCANAQHCIRTAGLWEASMCIDWPGQGIVSGLRKITLWICRAGTPPPAYIPGQLTKFDNLSDYERWASYDAPGSASTPNADAWITLGTRKELLDAGDSVFATVASETPGDWIQSSQMTFFEMALIKPSATGGGV